MSDEILAAAYQCELKLKSHMHALEDEQQERVQEIVTDLRDLRKDYEPDAYFGDLE